MIGTANNAGHGISGFFARIFAALILINLTTTGTLVYISYSYSSDTLARHAQEHIEQQVEVLAERFEDDHLRVLSRTLRELIDAPELDDYLLGSEAERLVLRRRIERNFKRRWQDFPAFSEICFIDDIGQVAVGLANGRRISTRTKDSSIDRLKPAARALFEQLRDTPLLLFSGNMEWFLPPRNMQVSAPIATDDGDFALYAGQGKLDKDTGLFGGAVIVRVELEPWLEELKQLRFFGVDSVWVLTPNNEVLLSPASVRARLDPRSIPTAQPKAPGVDDDRGLFAQRELTLANGEPLLKLAISVPAHLLSLELRPVLDFFSLVLIVSAVLLALVSYIISRLLSRPVIDLAVARNQLANAHRIARLGHWEWDIEQDNLVFSENVIGILDLGVPPSGVPMELFEVLIHPEDRAAFNKAINDSRENRTATSVEYRIRDRDGREQYMHQEIDPIPGEHERLVGTIQDVSERKETEAQIRELAYFDAVTNLANRRTLIETGGEALTLARSQHSRVGILFLDLDHFKRINDTMGHNAGDEFLRQVALRLEECARLPIDRGRIPDASPHENLVARLGGDEFVLLLSDLDDSSEAVRVAEHVCASLTVPFDIEGRELTTTGSIGISLMPEHGDNIDELLRRADAAMYHAKFKGRNRYEVYTEAIEHEVQRRVSMEGRLRRALYRDEFILHFQPRVNLASGRIAAVEGLIRWQDPELGLIGPDQFIPLAEENGLIVPIGDWVMRAACRELARWHKRWPTLSMSLNLSPAQFTSPDLLDSICSAADEAEIQRDRIELELTENALFADVAAGVRLAQQLKTLGFGLSIDDFGTGYSSLQLLLQFPVDALKIDREFIRDLLVDNDDAVIVKTAIGLAKNLGLKVVAEGVEQQEQFDLLKAEGCDEAQGYLLGRPMPADEFVALLESTELERIAEKPLDSART